MWKHCNVVLYKPVSVSLHPACLSLGLFPQLCPSTVISTDLNHHPQSARRGVNGECFNANGCQWRLSGSVTQSHVRLLPLPSSICGRSSTSVSEFQWRAAAKRLHEHHQIFIQCNACMIKLFHANVSLKDLFKMDIISAHILTVFFLHLYSV